MDHGLPEGVAAKLGPLGRYELRAALVRARDGVGGHPVRPAVAPGDHRRTADRRSTTARRGGSTTRFHGEDGVITVLNVVSFLGKPIFLLFAIGIPGLWIFLHGGRKLGIFLAVTCIGGGIVDTIVKVAVGRPRPEVEEPIIEAFGKSFPSGHSMQAVVCYGALLLVFLPLLNGRVRTLAIWRLRRAVPGDRLLPAVARRPLHQRRPRRLRARRRLAGGLGRPLRDLARGARQAPHPRHRGGRGTRGVEAAGDGLRPATGTRGPRSRRCCATRRGTGSTPWRPAG